jgi:hypothetical protein
MYLYASYQLVRVLYLPSLEIVGQSLGQPTSSSLTPLAQQLDIHVNNTLTIARHILITTFKQLLHCQ